MWCLCGCGGGVNFPIFSVGVDLVPPCCVLVRFCSFLRRSFPPGMFCSTALFDLIIWFIGRARVEGVGRAVCVFVSCLLYGVSLLPAPFPPPPFALPSPTVWKLGN
jgi:hypothetical protein